MDVDHTGDDLHLRFTMDWAAAQGAVAGFAHGLIPDPQAADELVQEVAVAAYRSYAGRLPTGTFTGWALGIARNLARMRARSHARSRTRFTDPALLDALAAINEELAEDDASERRALDACLREVSGRAWEVLRRHYWGGEAPAAIAAALGLEAGAVRVQLHRLRAALRACIERRLAGGPPR